MVRPILAKYMEVIDKYVQHSEEVGEKAGYELPEDYRTIRATLHEMLEVHMKRLGIDKDARDTWLNDSHVKELPNLNNSRQNSYKCQGHGENGNDKEDGAEREISIKKVTDSEKESSPEGQEWETATEGMGHEAEA